MAKSLPTPFKPPPPTTLLWWRHGFADAKRRRLFTQKLTFSKIRVSVTQICKFDCKNQGEVLRDDFSSFLLRKLAAASKRSKIERALGI